MPSISESLTSHERQVFAAEQKAARLRAEADRAERVLAELRGGEVRNPQVMRCTYYFNEPVLALDLTLSETQERMLTSIFKANGVHGSVRIHVGKAADDA